MNKKIVVADRAEAMKLIESGTNSMLIFSEEAPHGYKKDGTPAAPRGRKPLDPAIKAAREAKSAASGRKKPGPIVRTPEAPFGLKADGTPMKKRGRPRKEVAAPAAPAAPEAPTAPAVEPSAPEATPVSTLEEIPEVSLVETSPATEALEDLPEAAEG